MVVKVDQLVIQWYNFLLHSTVRWSGDDNWFLAWRAISWRKLMTYLWATGTKVAFHPFILIQLLDLAASHGAVRAFITSCHPPENSPTSCHITAMLVRSLFSGLRQDQLLSPMMANKDGSLASLKRCKPWTGKEQESTIVTPSRVHIWCFLRSLHWRS